LRNTDHPEKRRKVVIMTTVYHAAAQPAVEDRGVRQILATKALGLHPRPRVAMTTLE
jgi:hypothetical protein